MSKIPVFVRSESDIFSKPIYDITLKNTHVAEYYPQHTITNETSPITFFIPGNDIQYIDVNDIALYIRGSLKDSTGTALAPWATARCAPVNNFLHSLFQQCTVQLNEKFITETDNLYAYRAYIETILGYGGDYKDTQGRAAFYFKDGDASSTESDDYKARQEAIRSDEVDMIGKPHVDLCAQNRYLVPGIDVRISFQRSTNDFFVFAERNVAPAVQKYYRFHISEARLIVKKHTLPDSILKSHLAIWQKEEARYPMRRVEMKSYQIPIGTQQTINENLFQQGILPDRLILGIIPTADLNGSVSTNPFDFRHNDLSYISVTVNGEEIFHQKYSMNFNNKIFMEPYYNMFAALGVKPGQEGPHITLDEFIKGKTLFVFNLRDIQDGSTLPRIGTIRIEHKFRNATTKALTIVAHADYQSILLIDKHKKVFFEDFSNLVE